MGDYFLLCYDTPLPPVFISVAFKRLSYFVSSLDATLVGCLQVLHLKNLRNAPLLPLNSKEKRPDMMWASYALSGTITREYDRRIVSFCQERNGSISEFLENVPWLGFEPCVTGIAGAEVRGVTRAPQ